MFNSVRVNCVSRKSYFRFIFTTSKKQWRPQCLPTSVVDRGHTMCTMYSSYWSAWGSLIRRPMHLLVNQKPTSYRNLMTLMDMNPLLFPIFLHATSICICQWGGSCRERIPNESIQSPTAPVSKMSACCNRLTTLLLLSVCWTYNIISPSFYSSTTLLWIATDGCVEL